jgi:hypothetical protein
MKRYFLQGSIVLTVAAILTAIVTYSFLIPWFTFLAEETFMMKLLVVRKIKQGDNETTITFEQGQNALLSTNYVNQEDYQYYLRLAKRSRERQHPVGVDLDQSNIIVGMARADNDFPMQLQEYDQEKMQVLFQGHDGIFYLRRDHPDFNRLLQVLNQSIRNRNRVWFVAEKPRLFLIDIIPVE